MLIFFSNLVLGVDVRATLADQVQMRNWKLCDLPQDSHSVENAIVMAQARRYSLFIDPRPPNGGTSVFLTVANEGTTQRSLSRREFL